MAPPWYVASDMDQLKKLQNQYLKIGTFKILSVALKILNQNLFNRLIEWSITTEHN